MGANVVVEPQEFIQKIAFVYSFEFGLLVLVEGTVFSQLGIETNAKDLPV